MPKRNSECRLLIVDDDANLCSLLVEALKDAYAVDTCVTAGEAIRYIDSAEYDVVITDLKLPDATGIEILKHAKQRDRFTEVIIITGYGSFETAAEAINFGVTSYLTKPFKLEELFFQVEKAVANRMFHLKSLLLLTQKNYSSRSYVKSHIFNITSLYYLTSRLMLPREIAEIMEIILVEINEKLNTVYSVIGIHFLQFNELFAMAGAQKSITRDIVFRDLAEQNPTLFSPVFKEALEKHEGTVTIFEPDSFGASRECGAEKKAVNVPLSITGETFGFISLFFDHSNPLSKEQYQFFYVFTTLISSVIQHAYVDRRAKIQAKTDSLTGVANHRMFHETLDREIARAERNNTRFCLAMIDVDNFKLVNDSYGHLVGDAVLIDLAQRVGSIIRGGDLLSRYGGEEFALILPDTNIKGAEILANRICRKIARIPYIFSDKQIHYTVSIGLAAYKHEYCHDKDMLISMADKALYQAKNCGKNRVIVTE